MARRTPYIGAVLLRTPLRNSPIPPIVLGSDVRTMGGNLISLRPEEVSQGQKVSKFLFGWESLETVDLLKNQWLSGNTFQADLGGTGETVTVRYAAANGVANDKHVKWGEDVVPGVVKDTVADLWVGELNLIIIDED